MIPTAAELIAMRSAIDFAMHPEAAIGPNPRVGCILISNDGTYVAQGFHRGRGYPHAEIAAINNAETSLAGATAVVTLEPCLRLDRESSCATALVEAGITRIVIGQSDLTAQAAGGIELLKQKGVDVVTNVLSDECSSINPWFTVSMAQKLPYVRLKLVTSLDGRIAAQDGSSKWISSAPARDYVHNLRSQSSALISSVRSALVDQSQLSARNSDGSKMPNQPLVVLVGSSEISEKHPVFQTGNTVELFPDRDLRKLLVDLYQRQHLSVLVEAGPTLATALLKQQLVNELIWITAPVLMGDTGLPAIGDLGIDTISSAWRPHLHSRDELGLDFVNILQFTTEL
jgi:diaminohydroxyphosphoribosylaminopyrimidine deaminase / 5-amino-6-(5-phosphoribosylamino)uracil reductase